MQSYLQLATKQCFDNKKFVFLNKWVKNKQMGKKKLCNKCVVDKIKFAFANISTELKYKPVNKAKLYLLTRDKVKASCKVWFYLQ